MGRPGAMRREVGLAPKATKTAKETSQGGTAASREAPLEDPGFLRALLEVHQQLEFSDLLRVLVTHVADWNCIS